MIHINFWLLRFITSPSFTSPSFLGLSRYLGCSARSLTGKRIRHEWVRRRAPSRLWIPRAPICQTNRKRSVLLSCGRFDTSRRSTLSRGQDYLHTSHRAGRRSRSSITVVPPVVPLSWHSSTVRIRLSASVRTPKPAGPITTPTLGDAGRSSTILHRFVGRLLDDVVVRVDFQANFVSPDGAWYSKFAQHYEKTRMLDRIVELVRKARAIGVSSARRMNIIRPRLTPSGTISQCGCRCAGLRA